MKPTPPITVISNIAREYLNIETLEECKSDALDFHELAVWSIKAALEAAHQKGYEEGRASQL